MTKDDDGRRMVQKCAVASAAIPVANVARPRASAWSALIDRARATWDAMLQRLRHRALFRILEQATVGFLKGRVPSHAAAMAYYGVFALFPLMLLAMALAGLALDAEVAREGIMGVVSELLPQGQAGIRELVNEVVEARGTAAGLGVVALCYSGLSWFREFDANVNEIWGIPRPRSRVQSMLLPVGLALGSGVVALVSLSVTTAIDVAGGLVAAVPGGAVVSRGVASLLGVLTMAGIFILLYRYTPQGQVLLADVWPAGVAAAAVWELTRRLLAFYLETTNLVSGYGSIGAGMALLFWIYLAGIIIVTGAELACATATERRRGDPAGAHGAPRPAPQPALP